MRWLGLLAVALVLASGALASSSTVRKVSVTSPVRPGGVVTLRVDVAPRARCTVAPASGSFLPGTAPAPRVGGRITWRWRLRGTARAGSSHALVRCGAAGALRVAFKIAAEPELTLAAAARAACARVPERVTRRYRTQLIPLLDRTLVALREQYGAFDCAYGSNYYRDGGPVSYYLVSVKRGTQRCSYSVTTRVVWVSDGPLAGYTGPVDETYTETCSSLRS